MLDFIRCPIVLTDVTLIQILQIQTDAGLPPGTTSLSDTLDRLLCPDVQLDPGQAPPYPPQQVRQRLRILHDPY
jgi:hypothetical protein